jgi:hypothetical protein
VTGQFHIAGVQAVANSILSKIWLVGGVVDPKFPVIVAPQMMILVTRDSD